MLKNLTQLGKDAGAALSPLISDFRKWSPILIKLFHDQPLIGRKLAPTIEALDFDGMTEHETPNLEDMTEPDYGMEPQESNTGIQGGSVIVKTPQIFKTVVLLDDVWKRLFAGQARMPIIVGRMLEKVKNFEDQVIFRGSTKNALKGLVSTLTTDLGNPTGPWGQDTDANGILENMHADIEKGLDYLNSQGLGHLPVDVALTSYLFNRAKNTIVPYDPKTNNLMIIESKLNGGSVMSSNNIQASVSTSANTMVMIARTGPQDAAWQLLSSGFDRIFQPATKPWSSILGVREKFSVKVLDGKFILWMDGIKSTPT